MDTDKLMRAIISKIELDICLWYEKTLVGLRDRKECLDYVQHIIKTYPSEAIFSFYEGLLYEDIGLFQQAIISFENYLKHKPNAYNGFFKIAVCQQPIKEFAKAEKNYTQAIEFFDARLLENTFYNMNPKNYMKFPLESIYNNRSVCRYNLKDYQGAKDDADFAISLNPNYPNAIYQKGLFLLFEKNPDCIYFIKKAASLGYEQAIILVMQYGW